MIKMRILAIDPSGNFKEGRGTSGIALIEDGKILNLNEIRAKDFKCAEEYWNFHLNLIHDIKHDYLVIEGYRLYNHAGNKASNQTNSILETPQLIGVLRHYCYIHMKPLTIQYASDVKNRWSEKILVAKGYLEQKGNRYYWNGKPTNQHQRDALKHALHFERYGKKER